VNFFHIINLVFTEEVKSSVQRDGLISAEGITKKGSGYTFAATGASLSVTYSLTFDFRVEGSLASEASKPSNY